MIEEAAQAELQLSLENTPETPPDNINAVFGVLSAIPDATGRVGFCLDSGHANLHHGTRHDYVRFVDLLGDHVPIIHWHAHENWGDRDSHLPLFTGPSAKDDRGLRGLVRRLKQRGFAGSVILEQWPNPPEQLVMSRNRLTELFGEQDMNTRTLRTGISISELGLGCWAIGGPFWDRGGWMGYGDCDDAESLRCLRRAAELGVTFFDTASVYGCGHSEELIGEAFAGRSDIVISTKFGFTFDAAERKVTGSDASPAAIRQSLEGSLKRLRRETVDLFSFQLWDHPLEQAGDVLQTLDELVAEGKIRSYCWLTDDPERVRFFAQGKHCAGTGQLLNVMEQNPKLIALCEELGLPILARRPLGMGLLTGKFTTATEFPDNDMRRRFGWDFKVAKHANRLANLDRLRAVLTRNGRTLAQGAIAWVLARSPLAVPVPGFKNLRQLEENIAATRFGPLTHDDMREIADVLHVA